MRRLYLFDKLNEYRSLWRGWDWVTRINLLSTLLALLYFPILCFYSYDFGSNFNFSDFVSSWVGRLVGIWEFLVDPFWLVGIREFLVDLFWLVVPCTRQEWLTSLKHFVPDSLEQWAILVAVCVWFKSRNDRREEGIIRAWQVLLDAHNKSSDGGRKLALEFLNNSKNNLKYGLFGAVYPREDLEGVNLSKANLCSVNLTRAFLQGTNLTEAKLSGADLTGADLWGANLTEANLTEADLTRAKLGDANLQEANLWGADLTEAKLTEADLEEVNLTGAMYNTQEIDFYGYFIPPTKFPEGFDPVAAGMIDVSKEQATNKSPSS